MSGAPVLEAAVQARNGLVYVLDDVLTPPSILPVLPHRCDIKESKIFQVRFSHLLWKSCRRLRASLAQAKSAQVCPAAPPAARL